ncbi:hypothetical protein B7463_g12565, partial [Scytalidium lignicola]
MSEPSLPRPCPSTASLVGDNPGSDEDCIETGADKSLVDSTLSERKVEIPDSVEVKVENKQKRKRTSAHDQSILEAEYKRNSKPNKATRAEIVKLVALNEKEVQIWFQNRRQIDRRKSRPLLPHEVAALGIGAVPFSSDEASDATIGNYSTAGEIILSSQTAPGSSQEDIQQPHEHLVSSASVPLEDLNHGSLSQNAETAAQDTVETNKIPGPAIMPQLPSPIQSLGNSFNVSESVVQSFTSTPGYLANRWNSINSFQFTPPASQNIPFTPQMTHHRTHPSSCPERIGDERPITPPSQVRLSMSLEGKAELVSTVPSPVHFKSVRPSSSESTLRQKRTRGLQRSFSAVPFGSVPKNPSGESLVPRLLSGRSRDARTWELCCDTEARDELTKQAENESSGSAVAAISLLRSTSNSALKCNPQKRNVPPAKTGSTGWTKRQKLERSQSSLARLQTPDVIPLKPSQPTSDTGKDGLMRSPSGDSDKENRIPYEISGNPRRRLLPSSRTDKRGSSKRILEDNHNIPTHAVGFGIEKKRRRGTHTDPVVFEDDENEEVPEDVERFMRGEISPSKKGDLDCVQGLLSLSQGNWR